VGNPFRLGVDLGTTNTVAALQWPDGSAQPLLFDGSPTLPSAVCVDGNGVLVAGRDAIHEGRVRPENFEPNPKQRIDDVAVLLGGHEVPVEQLLAAVLSRVAEEARRVAGALIAEVVLTYPTTWGQRRRERMLAAADAARLGPVRLVPEAVAAAAWFVHHSTITLAPDAAIVIYDFGGGTFDASAIRRGPDGFTVLGEEGLRETGGLDVDAAIVGYLARSSARHTRRPGSGCPRRRRRRTAGPDRHCGTTSGPPRSPCRASLRPRSTCHWSTRSRCSAASTSTRWRGHWSSAR
jgi:molecular chaperone DnaK (HSP70)